jgi:3D (Asp-Asp-Asp) domain-containing protein
MEAYKSWENKIISINLAKKIVGVLFITFLFNFFFFAAPALANENNNIDINDSNSYYGIINPADDELYISNDPDSDLIIEEDIQTETDTTIEEIEGIINHLPNNEIKKPDPVVKSLPPAKPKGVRMVLMTAYNSEKAQTDDSPCTTATGFNVCKHGKEDTIAANFLKFGTKVKIPALYGDKVFIVRDRMNKRYSNKVDIWMTSRTKALQFGIKYAKIEIVP